MMFPKYNPLVTAIIPTYNRAYLLVDAVQDALSQTWGKMEVIVVDDGSTESIPAALTPWLDQITLITQENQGKSAALNNALKHAKGEWIAILDSDDRWEPQKTELQLRCLEQFPECGLCFSNSRFINNPSMDYTAFERAKLSPGKNTEKFTNTLLHVLSPPHGIFIQSMLIRKDILDKAGEFDTELQVTEDTDMIFRLALQTDFCCVNHPLVRIDRTPNRSIGLTDEAMRRPEINLKSREHLYTKWLDMLSDSRPELMPIIRRRLAEVYNERCNLELIRKQSEAAAGLLKRAILFHNTIRLRVKLLALELIPNMLRKLILKRHAYL